MTRVLINFILCLFFLGTAAFAQSACNESDLVKPELISRDTLAVGNEKVIAQLLGKKIIVKELSTSFPQEVLDLGALSAGERKMVGNILVKLNNPKFARRDLMAQFQDIKSFWLGRSEKKYGTPLPLAEVTEVAMSKVLNRGVEIGAWRVLLKNDEVLAGLFTSSRFDRIDGIDSENALNGIMKRADRDIREIKSVQMFHNHTKLLHCNLSVGDFETAMALKKAYAREGATPKIEIFSICVRPPQTFLFRLGI